MQPKITEKSAKETLRIEAFSDGVFAIAITLLVLELIQFLHIQSGEVLLKSYLHHWEPFVAFFIGFSTILVCWINHHCMFDYIKRSDTYLMWVNGFLLLIITFTPFPTAILAKYLEKESTSALAIFGFTYFLMSVAYDWVCSYAYKNHLVEEGERDFFYSFKMIYRYVVIYTLIVFFICFLSILVATVLYIIMFAVFAFPKEFAARLYKIRSLRKRIKN